MQVLSHHAQLIHSFIQQAPPSTLFDAWPHTMQVDAKRAERAERAKTRGNEAFKAGRFMDAIKAYSEALKLHPNNPIYANNRAMAYLKVFRCVD
jgi:Flp pilus assembly protein TadD